MSPATIDIHPSQRGRSPLFSTINPVARAKRLPNTSATLIFSEEAPDLRPGARWLVLGVLYAGTRLRFSYQTQCGTARIGCSSASVGGARR